VVLDKDTSDRIAFITFIVAKFAESYQMRVRDAYLYIKKYGGFDYLYECWWGLHTEDSLWSVHDINDYCIANGGLR
jgi:hypothetical protein